MLAEDGTVPPVISATRHRCMATDADRQALVARLVEAAVAGEGAAVWGAAGERLRAKWEAEGAARKKGALDGAAFCAYKHEWRRRGVYQRQKLVSWSEKTCVAVVHVYFRQGPVEQVPSYVSVTTMPPVSA